MLSYRKKIDTRFWVQPIAVQNDSILKDSCFQSPVWYPNRWEEEDVEAYLQALFDHKNDSF